ncbi:MAG: DNA-processing protein DprA [Pseudomonadota bacterium]
MDITPSKTKLTDTQKLNWLRLIRSENVGPVTFRQLINKFGGAAEALEALPHMSKRGGSTKPIRIYSIAEAEKELKTAQKIGADLVALGEMGYPPWLATIDAPMPLLYTKGNKDLVEKPIIAIVGSRNGSAIGQKFTRMIASELGREGHVIVSGLARGIDTAAHQAALEAGTLAVLAGGLDIIYPPENADLHYHIGQKGLLISEMPPGFKPRGQDFPRRNRIISGMAIAVLVIEAASRSGSLVTARFAAEQGREVFAVPGNPLDPRAAGTNKLIKDGANLLTCAKDVMDTIAPMLGQLPDPSKGQMKSSNAEMDLSTMNYEDITLSDRERVIQALSPCPTDIDEIIRYSGVDARLVHIVLLELDLAGRLERHGRQLVSIQPTQLTHSLL